jgi:hypothetical protein
MALRRNVWQFLIKQIFFGTGSGFDPDVSTACIWIRIQCIQSETLLLSRFIVSSFVENMSKLN